MIPFGASSDGPESEWADGVTLRVYAPSDQSETVTPVPAAHDSPDSVTFITLRAGDEIVVETESALPWNVLLVGATPTEDGEEHPLGALYRCAAGVPRLTTHWT